jgi:hypothetical protein
MRYFEIPKFEFEPLNFEDYKILEIYVLHKSKKKNIFPMICDTIEEVKQLAGEALNINVYNMNLYFCGNFI